LQTPCGPQSTIFRWFRSISSTPNSRPALRVSAPGYRSKEQRLALLVTADRVLHAFSPWFAIVTPSPDRLVALRAPCRSGTQDPATAVLRSTSSDAGGHGVRHLTVGHAHREPKSRSSRVRLVVARSGWFGLVARVRSVADHAGWFALVARVRLLAGHAGWFALVPRVRSVAGHAVACLGRSGSSGRRSCGLACPGRSSSFGCGPLGLVAHGAWVCLVQDIWLGALSRSGSFGGRTCQPASQPPARSPGARGHACLMCAVNGVLTDPR
jgi:hypothetical protein